MATTSLKLPDSLKERIVKLAADTGKSTHAFMVEAIAEQTERIEEDRAFMARAVASKKHHDETGIGYDGDEVHAYLRAKIQGSNPAKPRPIKRIKNSDM
jgi:predicted transcriptional regulator